MKTERKDRKYDFLEVKNGRKGLLKFSKGRKDPNQKKKKRAWAERNGTQEEPSSEAVLSEAQAASMTPVQRGITPAQPDDSDRPSRTSKTKGQDTMGTERLFESNSEK